MYLSHQIAPKIKSCYATFLREFQNVKIIKQSQMGVSVIALKNWTLCQVQCNLDSVSIGDQSNQNTIYFYERLLWS